MKYLSLFACFLVSSFFGYSGTIIINNTNDSGTGSLRQSVIDATDGDTLRFDNSLINSGSATISLIDDISISKNLTIIGCYNSTDTLFISGNNTTRIFDISSTTYVTLDSLILKQGNGVGGTWAGYGGAILVRSTDSLTIRNSILCQNTCNDYGGALYFESDTLILENTIFSSNSANYGGAITISKGSTHSLRIHNSTFNNNTASEKGGAIFASAFGTCNMTMSNSIVNNNTAGDNGGGIYLYAYSNLTIDGSLISNNTSTSGDGGGIFMSEECWLKINNSTIEGNNAAGGFGGGVYALTTCNVEVEHSTLNDNYTANKGAAIFSYFGYVSIEYSTLVNNIASIDGGAIFLSSSDTLLIKNSTLFNNAANEGEAIYASSSNAEITIQSSIIASSSDNINDFGASIVSGGYNIFSDSPVGAVSSDQINLTSNQVNLGNLGNNGGTTKTMAPLAGSIALNAGNPLDLTPAQNVNINGVRDVGAAEACSSEGIDTQVACDSFTWIDGLTYTSDNNSATHTIQNAAGCDSLITLNLTVNYSSSTVDLVQDCNPFLWIDGNTYSADNNTATYTFVKSNGCDSVVTLNFTRLDAVSVTDVQSACESYTWTDGSTYTSNNNTATQTLSNSLGCDSIVTLSLTINYSTTATDIVSGCNSYTWIDGNTYSADNTTATYLLENAAGCDSMVTLSLTIVEIDTTVTLSSTTLSSNEAGAFYQWLDCNNNNTVIDNETNQTYEVTSAGNYAVSITNNGCSVISECTQVDISTGIDDKETQVKVFPNPTSSLLILENIDVYSQLVVVDITGKELINKPINANKLNIDLSDYRSGLYLVKLSNDQGQSSEYKVVLE